MNVPCALCDKQIEEARLAQRFCGERCRLIYTKAKDNLLALQSYPKGIRNKVGQILSQEVSMPRYVFYGKGASAGQRTER